ncbi:S8 family serine peptidase [Neobacillus niacini]|uniref:S8 family serine peptidase n=1 Tax=Neobacillus niacini TaxID=86668 RepID=UPI003982E3A8
MKKIKTSRILAGALLVGMTLSQVQPYNVLAQNNIRLESTDTINLLKNLTPAQREALPKLAALDQEGLQLSSDVNLDSSKPVSVIVQFKNKPHKVAVLNAAVDGHVLSEAQAKKNVDGDHATFNNDLKANFKTKSDGSYKVIREYKNAFNGVALEVPANKLEGLVKSKAVQAIYSNSVVTVEQPVQEAAPSKEAKGQGMAAERSFLNIDKLHEEGFTGKGIKVAVLDTGIDHKHPDLKDAYVGGYDFVDNDNDPMETTYDDWVNAGKPGGTSGSAAYVTEHGTHVSGTIAGQGTADSAYATTGVAPDVDLYGYRVLGPGGSGTSEAIIAGIEKAVLDGVDIMNLSLGANYNDPLTPQAIAINNAVLNGVTAVVAAGNAGSEMYTVGTPGNAPLALTVGASTVPGEIATMKATVDTQTADLRLMAKGYESDLNTLLSPTQPFQFVYVGLGLGSNYTGANTRVDGKIVVVQRGSNTMNDKILQAKNRGAVAVIVINNNQTEGHLPFNIGEGVDFVPAFSMTYTDGVALLQKLNTGKNQISFSDIGELPTPGDVLADFSSRGPSRLTYDIKPEVVAPGVNMLSTVPGFINSPNDPTNYDYAYGRMSGTSMATPFTSGVAALLLEAKPELQPEDVKAILMNTADPLSKPYSVYEVGAGRINPYNAIHSNFEIVVDDKAPTIVNGKQKLINEKTAAISFGNKAYNDRNITDSRSVTLFNHGANTKTFNVSVKFNPDLRGSKDASANGVTLTTDSSITVKGNAKKKTTVALRIPKTAEKGIYEGYIVYTNKDDSSESYEVPFGVHFVESGIENFTLFKQSGPESRVRTSQKYDPWTGAFVTLKSHMKYIDVIISDAKTGKDLGYLGTFNGLAMLEGVQYGAADFYRGYYFPFTNNPANPIDTNVDNIVVPKAGHYLMKLVAVDDYGKTYTVTQDFFVDGTKPKWDMHIEGEIPGKQVVEYKDGQSLLDVTAQITDDNVELKQAIGIKTDQSQNEIYYTYNSFFPNGNLTLDKDGNATDQIAMLPQLQVLDVKFEGMDEATNGYLQKQYYFVNEHTPYVHAQPNISTIHNRVMIETGKTFTMTLTANNVSKLMKANYKFQDTDATKITNISLNPEAQKLGGTLDVKQTALGSATSSDVTVNFNSTTGVDGDIPMVDLTVQVPTSLSPFKLQSFDMYGVTSTFTNVDNVSTKPFTDVPPIVVLGDQTEVKGFVQAQGLLNAQGGKDITRDFSKISPIVTVTDSKGKEVKTEVVTKGGQFVIAGLDPSKDDYLVKQDIPGHFNTYKTFNAHFELDGKIYGHGINNLGSAKVPVAIAGDVNKDDVIDIMDALAIQTYWGTNKRSTDINFDGTVDAKDFAFVEKNFSMQNPWVTTPPKAKEKYKGKTLEIIKTELTIK